MNPRTLARGAIPLQVRRARTALASRPRVYLVPKYNCCSYSGFYTILRTPSSFRHLQGTSMMFECPDCGSASAFYSRRRGLTEKYLLPFLLLRPYRCADCFQRCYRTIFISAREARQRKSAASGSGPTTQGRHVA